MKKKSVSGSLIKGAAVLGIAGILCRMLGLVYRVFLSNIIGTGGMGNYQLAHTVFVIVLTVATGGVPVAISRLVAARMAKRDPVGAHAYFMISLKFLACIGFCCSLLLFLLSAPISRFMGLESAERTLKVVSPAIFLVAIESAYRGYYQGMQNMTPTAASQLVEQATRIIFGLCFAGLLVHKGDEYGAVGAMIGLSLSEAAGCLTLLVFKRKRPPAYERRECPLSFRTGLEKLLTMSLPMTVGSAVLPIVNSIDSAIIMTILLDIGYDAANAASLFGLYMGFVTPLISMPAVLSTAVSMAVVPALTTARVNDRRDTEKKQIVLSLKISTLMGIPIAAGMYALALPILKMLYGTLTPVELDTAAELLRIVAPGVLFLAVSQILGGVLQGMGKISLPVINLLMGAVVKIVMGASLIRTPELNIKGAAIGTVVCYMVTAVLNTFAVIKCAEIKFPFWDCIFKPLLASAVMASAALFIHSSTDMLPHTLSLILSIVAGVIVYGAVILLTGAWKVEDMKKFTGKKTRCPPNVWVR